ncbi:unnamed protein product [Allacma fusca]|uniref:Uncharacterized protein n=1 Tax=Allacma fusca TaxID=39272 RepID=A0A8J2L3P1_9HEXA|nr:unnamed protein product [Allacma fusca]
MNGLYAGNVFYVPPHRHKALNGSYPFQSTHSTTFLPMFDDIYVALCAKKMGIKPYHTNYFRFWPAPVRDPYEKDYKYVITSHGFDDPEELRSFWNVEKSLEQALRTLYTYVIFSVL